MIIIHSLTVMSKIRLFFKSYNVQESFKKEKGQKKKKKKKASKANYIRSTFNRAAKAWA